MPKKLRFGMLMAALWWGSLTALGALVVPLLFQNLGSPQVAGAMAAKLFAAQTWLSIGCAMVLLLLLNKKEDMPHPVAQSVMPWLVAGLLLAVLVEFGVSPRIVTVRATGGDLKLWHGLGSAMYLAQWLSATLVLWRMTALAASTERAD